MNQNLNYLEVEIHYPNLKLHCLALNFPIAILRKNTNLLLMLYQRLFV